MINQHYTAMEALGFLIAFCCSLGLTIGYDMNLKTPMVNGLDSSLHLKLCLMAGLLNDVFMAIFLTLIIFSGIWPVVLLKHCASAHRRSVARAFAMVDSGWYYSSVISA